MNLWIFFIEICAKILFTFWYRKTFAECMHEGWRFWGKYFIKSEKFGEYNLVKVEIKTETHMEFNVNVLWHV